METMKNQDLQALEQIGGILSSLGPDSYIAAALKRSFGIPQSDRPAPQKAPAPPDELWQVRLSEQTVREWENSTRKKARTVERLYEPFFYKKQGRARGYPREKAKKRHSRDEI